MYIKLTPDQHVMQSCPSSTPTVVHHTEDSPRHGFAFVCSFFTAYVLRPNAKPKGIYAKMMRGRDLSRIARKKKLVTPLHCDCHKRYYCAQCFIVLPRHNCGHTKKQCWIDSANRYRPCKYARVSPIGFLLCGCVFYHTGAASGPNQQNMQLPK